MSHMEWRDYVGKTMWCGKIGVVIPYCIDHAVYVEFESAMLHLVVARSISASLIGQSGETISTGT